MFERQWFSDTDQIGLDSQSIALEETIRSHNIRSAWAILIPSRTKRTQGYVIRQSKRLLRISTRAKGVIGLFYDGFWPGFSPDRFILHTCLQHVARLLGIEVNLVYDPSDAHISIYSCFPRRYQMSASCHTTRILYLGENVRPSYTDYDYSFSCDLPSYCGRNFYCPVWLNYIFEKTSDILNASFQERLSILARQYKPYCSSWEERDDVFIHVGNNREPFRTSLITDLSQSGGKVEVYGSQTRPLDEKYQTYGKSRYVICPENSYHPGYVTEKLIDGLLSYSLPIYWGSLPDAMYKALKKVIYLLPHDGSLLISDLHRLYQTRSEEDVASSIITVGALAEEANTHICNAVAEILSIYL